MSGGRRIHRSAVSVPWACDPAPVRHRHEEPAGVRPAAGRGCVDLRLRGHGAGHPAHRARAVEPELRRAPPLAHPRRPGRHVRPQRHRHRRQDPHQGRRGPPAVVGVGRDPRARVPRGLRRAGLPAVVGRAAGDRARHADGRAHGAADRARATPTPRAATSTSTCGPSPATARCPARGSTTSCRARPRPAASATPATSRCGRPPSRASRRGRRRGAGAGRAGTSSARRWPPSTSARSSTSTAAASTWSSRTTRTSAPSRNAAGDPFARFWLHNAWVTLGGEKMSKSLGNTLSIDALLRRVRGVELRYYLVGPALPLDDRVLRRGARRVGGRVPADRVVRAPGARAGRPARGRTGGPARRSPPRWTTTWAPRARSPSCTAPSARATPRWTRATGIARGEPGGVRAGDDRPCSASTRSTPTGWSRPSGRGRRVRAEHAGRRPARAAAGGPGPPRLRRRGRRARPAHRRRRRRRGLTRRPHLVTQGRIDTWPATPTAAGRPARTARRRAWSSGPAASAAARWKAGARPRPRRCARATPRSGGPAAAAKRTAKGGDRGRPAPGTAP